MSTHPPTDYPGLTASQVAERVARGEANEFKIHIGRTYWQIVRDNLFNLFNIVLATLVVIMLFFRDYANVVFASFSVVLNSVVGLVQEISAKNALEKLAAMQLQQVKVWRDGKLITVPVNGLVVDDVIPVEPGDRIAVDGRVIEQDSLEMNEALLTGESDSIFKVQGETLYSGSFVIAGSATMVVTQVGANATINKLAATAKAYRQPLTPTQIHINQLVKIAVAAMLLFGPMTVIAGFANRIEVIDTVRNAVVLVTSMVPQGLVLVTTISLTLGALLISRNQTLVQRVNAVESMANVNVLCFDKTGTLTRNQLAVSQIIPLNDMDQAALADPLQTYVGSLANLNRTAGAIEQYLGKGVLSTQKLKEIPFTSARKWGAVVFADATYILGAPERVLDVGRDQEAIRTATTLAAQGERVLAFARAATAPDDQKLPAGREALALIVMSDQVRPEIGETIRQFKELAVELKVISGDNLETVKSIAHRAGMREALAYTGDQIEAMSQPELESAVREANVFARIEPETKRKIIRTLKAQGNYVAMVGDGVNDVPALKEANMAVAMNDGAQIAKDVADIVLLNNSMATLPFAFERGKTITQKILGTTKIFLIKNFYTVLAFVFIGFMALPFPTTPILISWLTFGVVNIPGGLIAFGFLRPAYMRSFSHDVMRYVTAGVIVGSVSMAVLYAGMYLYARTFEFRYDEDFSRIVGEIAPNPADRTPDNVIRAVHRAESLPRDVARSALFVFMTLYGTVIFLNTLGVDIFKLETVRAKPRIAVFGIVIIIVTLAAPYVLPQIFPGYRSPSLLLWGVSTAGGFIAAAALHYGLRDGRITQITLGAPSPSQS